MNIQHHSEFIFYIISASSLKVEEISVEGYLTIEYNGLMFIYIPHIPNKKWIFRFELP